MNLYEQFIDEVVFKLGGTISEPINLSTMGVEVMRLKEKNGEFKELSKNTAGRVTVAFFMDRFGTDADGWARLTGEAQMEREVVLLITVSSYSLYGPVGALSLLGICSGLLLGFRPSFGGECELLSGEFRDFESAIWHKQLAIKLKKRPIISIENFRGDNIPMYPGVTIKEINLDEEFISPVIVDNLGNPITIDGQNLTAY